MFLLRSLLLICCCTLVQSVSAQLYTFRNYNHRDGLIMESTLSAAQDVQGYLWVGTDGGGLMRFDGKKFVEAGPTGKSYQYHVSSIYPKPDGTVYFSTLYDGIFKFVNNKYKFVYKSTGRAGNSLHLSMIDSSLVLISDFSISIISESGIALRELKFSERKPIQAYQVLKLPQGVLIFSNVGNYLVKNNRITPLANWYRSVAAKSFEPRFGTFIRNKLILYDKTIAKKLELVLTNDGSIFSGKLSTTDFSVNTASPDPILQVAERQGTAYMLTEKGIILRIENGRLRRIVQNYSGTLDGIKGMHVDQNSDLWINTSYGMFKVSIEPFTKVDLDPIYQDKTISVIHRTKSGTLIMGNFNRQLYIGRLYSSIPPKVFSYRIYQVSESGFGTYIATDEGILKLQGKELRKTDFPFQQGKPISLLHWDGKSFWYSPFGEGLVRYTPGTKETKRFRDIHFDFADHFYTARNNFDNSVVYFGSNNGIYLYTMATGKLEHIDEFQHVGSYCGNSTTDRYGTCWFTLDKGIAGITSRGDYVTIEDDSKLPSTLFYTLSSDNYGNLLAGTNKGINIIEVDRNGYVLKQNNYSFKEGFGGYETHMRSQFQAGNYCYVGTIEGLYLINTEILREYPKPPKPVIFFGRENLQGELITNDDKVWYTFKCLLPKSNAVLYSYRIRGHNERWSDFSFQNEVNVSNLSNGEYQLEVRASYDGISISDTAVHIISIAMPIWQTKWFIVVIVIVLGILNIAYLEWSKSYLSTNIFNTKDVTVDVKVIPRLILFGMIVNSVMLVIVDQVEETVASTFFVNILFSSALLLLYAISRYYVRNIGNAKAITTFFYIAYGLIMVEDYILIYQTNIHPFPLFSITMTTSVIPFVIARIRWVIIICLTQLFAAATLLIWLEDTVYNEILFIAAITISGGLAVMITYLRNDSLEKLIFVSGVINQGNVIALSFNQKGVITYCSENISDFLDVDFTSVIGKQSSILNPFTVSSEMRNIHLAEEFEDGKVFLVPMYDKHGEVMWIEWSCKYFNESVRVIMGQDVTDKLTLSTNYQSLVENAQDMIFNTDVNGNFIFANERCVQLFGYRNEAIIGKNTISLIAPEHRERVKQFYVDQFRDRIHYTYLEFPIRSRDGRIFWVGQNTSLLYEPGSRKRISGFLALARDITEKRANDLLIEQQNKDITASINYAKRIQFNLLPDNKLLHTYFEQSFVLYRPKDIVSGDFYWLQEVGNKLILVVGDCTGHGVPGAFMTILGINLLNQIVRERKQYEPDVILNQLNTELRAILAGNQGTALFDGMNALIAVFEGDTLDFASSGVHFIHQTENGPELYRPAREHPPSMDEDMVFQKQRLTFAPADSFYLFTDGYQKQFGSIRNKKFSFRRMQELLETVHVESMPLQKKYFENAWRNWSEGHEQTDDITVLGLRGFKRLGQKE